MSDYSTVACCEEHGTRSENYTGEGVQCSVTLRCAYDDRWLLVQDVIGGHAVWPHLASAARPPVARTAGIVPFPAKAGTSGQLLLYDEALVTVNYETSKKESSGEDGQLFAESLEPTIEFLTLSPDRFRWSSATGDPLEEEEAPGMQLFSMALNRTIYQVEPPLDGGLLSLVGKCNAEEYVSAVLGLTFPEETLLFMPGTQSRTVTTELNPAFDVNLKFAYKPQGWNKYWRAKTESWEHIYLITSGSSGGEPYKSYPPDDFQEFLF